MSSAVPILTYHSLDDSGSVISMPPQLFRRQMEALKARGFAAVALDALCDAWEGKGSLPQRPVVLTFDDGYRNVLEHGAPVLSALGFRATMFVLAGRAGQDNGWDGQPASIPRLPLCNWSEVRALREAGISIGSHGVSHASLPELPPEAAAREIADARSAIEQEIGAPVRELAYAYGASTASHRELARASYRAACGVMLREARAADDRFDLPRIDAFYLRSGAAFRLFGTAAGGLYLGLRGLVRALRSSARR